VCESLSDIAVSVSTSPSKAVKNLLELLCVADATSYDHDLIVSALLMTKCLLGGAPDKNKELRKQFATQAKGGGLPDILNDILDIGDVYCSDLAHTIKAAMLSILKPLEPPKPPPPPKPAAPPPPPPGPAVRATLSRLPSRPRVDPGPKPTAKMKGFFWDKIPDPRIDGTFWENHAPSKWLDYEEVEKLFQVGYPFMLEFSPVYTHTHTHVYSRHLLCRSSLQ
jgi:hypothetical protein